jgi:hypothetical protein
MPDPNRSLTSRSLALAGHDWKGFVIFAYLQALDLLTTVAFLMSGVAEANPLVRFAIGIAPTPLLGLTLVKLLAIGLAFVCLIAGRAGLLRKANWCYALLILWNLVSLILGLHLAAR